MHAHPTLNGGVDQHASDVLFEVEDTKSVGLSALGENHHGSVSHILRVPQFKDVTEESLLICLFHLFRELNTHCKER